MRRGGVGRGPGRGVGRGPGRPAARRTVRRRARRRRRRRIILVGGMVALGAHALSKNDVQRVEEHTGKTAEELSDEELEQAMGDLGIEGQEMTDEQWAEVEAADAQEDDYIEQLERLSELKDKGILTEEEFEAKKKQLLGL